MRTLTLIITFGAIIIGCCLASLTAHPAVAHSSLVFQAKSDKQTSDYPIHAVPRTDVHITDNFWRPRIEINRSVTIPHIMRQNELTGRVDNFLKAARKMPGEYKGQRYNDTDVYKIIEAASYSLAAQPNPTLDKQVDNLIAIIAAAQEPDGYLYTPRSVDPENPAPGAGPERWSYLHTSHELYDMGHMIEAAVAHFQSTGKRSFLNVAIKSADLMCKVFGPTARRDVPGHEEVELALVKLYRATGNRKYLDQAKFFLDERGRAHTVPPAKFGQGSRFFMYNDLSYRQDHLPVVEQKQAVGHAVRATYLYIGMTDVATMLGVEPFAQTVETLFRDVTAKRIYVTGGLGSEGQTEAFSGDYVLPNRAYAETCASIGGILWYDRMFRRDGDATYLDVLERTLYNGYLSGVSLVGDKFFYQNPLESDGRRERSAYFDVACCPANLSRLMEQVAGLIYAQRDKELFVNLFIGSDATVKLSGTTVRISQETDYPWQGKVKIRVSPDQPMDLTLRVRIPGWSRGEAMPSDLYRFTPSADDVPKLAVNGKAASLNLEKGFASIKRRWQKGDVVELDLPMPIRRVLSHEGVTEDRGRAAIQRGPVVYCLEAVDNDGPVKGLRLPLEAELRYEFKPDLLRGVTVITGKASVKDKEGAWREQALVAIPYYAWANRGRGEMAVWIPYQ